MKRFFFVFLSAILAAGSGAAHRCVAQSPPDLISHYKILPRLSTMDQSGGPLAIPDLRYRVSGDYDFVRLGLPPGGAKFANSDVIGTLIGPTATPPVVDVDQIFNMDGLTGKRLPVASIYDVYQFKGTNSEGESVNLYASLLGPWMYLRGAAQPPSSSPGLFTYQLKALARTGPFADLNGDGVVDAIDYLLMRKTGSGSATDIAAGATLADWRQEFSDNVPDIALMDAQLSAALAGAGLAAASVPEPNEVALAVIGALLIGGRKRAKLTAM